MKKYPRAILILFLTLFFEGVSSINAGWFQEDVAVCTDETIQQGAVISPDSMGGVIVAWADGRNADVYAQRYDAAGNELWAPDGVNVSDIMGTQKLPRIIPDGTGGAFIVFESDTNTRSICRATRLLSVIIVAKVDPNGTVQWKKRISDATATSLYEYEPVREFDPLAFSDGHGGAIIVWMADHDLHIVYYCFDSPPDCCWWMARDSYAQRIDADGNMLWGSTPVLICANNNNPQEFRAAFDSLGATYLAWCDWKPYNSWSNIYAQKLDTSGHALWGPDGITVAAYSSLKVSPMILSDGVGGAVIAWKDDRDTNHEYYKLYAQRVDSLGNSTWSTNGVAVSTSHGEKLGVGIILSGSNGYIIAWMDDMNGKPSLFIQRLDSSGDPLWQSNGIMVSNGVSKCQYARIIPDGERGAVLAWEQIPTIAANRLSAASGDFPRQISFRSAMEE